MAHTLLMVEMQRDDRNNIHKRDDKLLLKKEEVRFTGGSASAWIGVGAVHFKLMQASHNTSSMPCTTISC